MIYKTLRPKLKTVSGTAAREMSLPISAENFSTKKFITQSLTNIPDMPSQYTYLDGTIAPSETKNLELIIPANFGIIHLLWDPNSGDLDLGATDPDGVVVANDDFMKEPCHISIIPSTFPPGNWKLTITSAGLSKSTNYYLIAYMYESGMQLTPSTEKFNYFVGEKVTLTAEFTSGSDPLIGATVTANIYSVEDHTSLGQISLYDDGRHGDSVAGDGIYTSNEWIPSQRGKQEFEITALITQNGQEFYKQATDIMINVIDDRVTFSGNNSDHGEDIDGNGKYDSLKINIGLTSSVVGDYTFSAELYDPDDNLISNAYEEMHLDSGTNSVELDFNGKNIFDLGFNGPYHFKNVAILSLDGELMASGEDIYTTSAYSYTDFEGPALSFSGTQSDEGLDDDGDGDGKYNYLKWNFNLSVAAEGTYMISASLKTSAGLVIETIDDSRHLSAGINVQTLYFDGIKIRNSGSDGPYLIDDVVIAGEGHTLSAEGAYTTASYDHTDFEQITSPDLSICSDDITFQNLGHNVIAVSVKVHNFGVSTPDNFKIELYQGPKGSGILLGEDTIKGLGQDESSIKTFNWGIDLVPEGIYTIYAYVNNDRIVSEYDYSNNKAFKDIDLAQYGVHPDTTPPTITCPADMTVPATGPLTKVTYTATASDDIDPNPTITYIPAPNSEFPLGTTEVKVDATDASGNSSTCTFKVTVVDNTPPAISITGVTGNSTDLRLEDAYGYWGPDDAVFWNKDKIVVSYNVTGGCDPNPTISFTVEWEGEPKDIGTLDTAAKTITIDPSSLIGDVKVTLIGKDSIGNSTSVSTAFTIVLYVPEKNMTIKPEILLTKHGMLTALLFLPAPYSAKTVSDAKCDGAPLAWMKARDNKSILNFKRKDIAVLPIDTHFTLRGVFTCNGKQVYFQTSDAIRRAGLKGLKSGLRGQVIRQDSREKQVRSSIRD